VCDGNVVSIALIGIWGVWTPQAEVLFDIRVTDTDTASYVDCSVATVLASAEKVKKKYLSAADHASFTPCVVSVDEAFEHEALMFLQWPACLQVAM